MGTDSSLFRYREAGEGTNVKNAARFGEPVRSLFTSTKILTLHHHIDITNEAEEVVYSADSKAISLHDRTEIKDAAGKVIAHIDRKVMTLHQRHIVTMSDGVQFDLSSEIFHIVKDVIDIEGLGWQLRGNILQLNFELYDKDGSIIAVIGQKAVSIHDKYCIDIYKPQAEAAAVAILVTLQHMIRDREAGSAGAASSTC